MKKKLKAMRNIAMSGLTLGALSSAGTSMGSPLVGNLSQGYGSMMGATGSILGAGVAIDSARSLLKKRKR